jgi:hypothetical protein
MVATRNSKKKRSTTKKQKRIQRGGVFDCPPDFTKNMREASFGNQYTKISIGTIHENGETQSFKQLQEQTLLGLVDWYDRIVQRPGNHKKTPEDRRRFDYHDFDIDLLVYKKNDWSSEEEWKTALDTIYTRPFQQNIWNLNNTEKDKQKLIEYTAKGKEMFTTLSILGVFYHRFKIVAERYADAIKNYNAGIYGFLQGELDSGKYGATPETIETYKDASSYARFMKDEEHFPDKAMRDAFEKLALYDTVAIQAVDLPIETAIDRSQCALFTIVKTIKMPAGFVMDERVVKLANTPINLDSYGFKNGTPLRKMTATINCLNYIISISEYLSNPEVTF